jgi:hypothetical protein
MGTKATSGLICNSDFINKGTLKAGTSTITLAGNRPRSFVNTPSDGPLSAYYNLELGEGNTTSTGNIVVSNQLTLHGTLTPSAKDTVVITSNSPGAITDTGSITLGTVSRAIAQGDTNPYRFESPSTSLQFNGAGSYPGEISITVLPDTVPASFQLLWKVIPGIADTLHNTVDGDAFVRSIRFAFGPPKGNGSTIGTPLIQREYVMKSSGGGGTAQASIQLSYDQSEVPASTPETPLQLLTGPFITDSLRPLWNMVSVPLIPPDPSKDSLFPGATTPAFAYQGAYTPTASLSFGVGYWLRMNSAPLITIFGDDVERDTLSLTGGWNLIGGLSLPLSVKSASTLPPSQISSRFFGYQNGYTVADSLRPMHAYWVKVKTDCSLILFTPGAPAKTAPGTSVLAHLGRVVLKDASGSEQSLYFGSRNDINMAEFELPPRPPDGVFDARFSTQRMLDVVDRGAVRETPILLSSAAYPMTIRWSLDAKEGIAASIVLDGRAVPIEGSGEIKVAQPLSSIRLRMAGGSRASDLPKAFALMQNYPNPFNPSTTIRYDLPVESNVSLKIYNMMGQEVRTLVKEVRGAGSAEAVWNSLNDEGTAVSSGVYFYRIHAAGVADPSKTYIRVRKMMLLR